MVSNVSELQILISESGGFSFGMTFKPIEEVFEYFDVLFVHY